MSGKGRMPMRRFVALAALAVALVCALVPSVSFTEDRDTVQLAKVIYALARDESYATKLAIGTVVMNRVRATGSTTRWARCSTSSSSFRRAAATMAKA